MRVIRYLASDFMGAMCALFLAASPLPAATATNPVCAELASENSATEAAEAKLDDLLPPPPKTSWEAGSPQAKALCEGFRNVAIHVGKAAALGDKAIEACAGTEEEVTREDVVQMKKSASIFDQRVATSCGMQ